MPGPVSATVRRTRWCSRVELAGEPDAPGRRLRLLAHRVVGIGDEIHQDLMELVGVRPQRRQPGGELAGHLDTVRAQLVGQHLESALDHHVDRHRPALRWPLPGQGQEVLHDPGAPVGRGLDLLGAAGQRFVLGAFAQQVSVPGQHRQRIVELVGNTGQQ